MHPSGSAAPRAVTALAVLLAAVVVNTSAHATVVRALDVAQKARIAQAIVVARVEKQEPRWMTEGGAVKTIVTLTVEQTLKGKPTKGQKIQVVIPGGRIGDLVHEVSGTSSYTAGERAVLFLEPHPDGWVELGIGIGKYDVKDVGGVATVTHDPKVALLKSPDAQAPHQPSRIEPAKPMAPVALPKFIAEIRAALSETP